MQWRLVDTEPLDARLLRRLAQRRVPQRGVPVLAVTAELQPPPDPRVQGEQRPLAAGVQNQRRGRQMPRHARPRARIVGSCREEREQGVLERALPLLRGRPSA
ncbi:hypothetical protein GCM10009608_68090 [Pseudonocardia alaniniphila]